LFRSCVSQMPLKPAEKEVNVRLASDQTRVVAFTEG